MRKMTLICKSQKALKKKRLIIYSVGGSDRDDVMQKN